MKWVVRFAGLLATIIGSVVVIGWLLPQNHVTARSVEYRAPMDTVWKLITDIASMPGWRTDLARVEFSHHSASNSPGVRPQAEAMS